MLLIMVISDDEEARGNGANANRTGRVVLPDHYAAVYARIYDHLGRFYDPFVRSALFFMNGGPGGERRWRTDAVDFLDPAPGERIVDLCSGTGTLTIMIAERLKCSGEVIGVEISEAQLRVAKKKSLPPGLTYLHASATDTDLPDGRFDKAVICAALHEMLRETRGMILAEAFRLLRPGGRLVAVEHHEPRQWYKALLINAFEYLTPEYPTYRDLLESGLRNEVETAGFSTLETSITASGYFQMILAEKPCAIEMEKSGHRFFTEASNKVKHEVGRKLFARLAAEEIDHMKTFEKIFNEVSGGADWKESMKAIQARKPVPYFDEARKEFKAEDLSVEMTYLKKALDLERNAMEFFEKAIEDAETAEAKEIFRRIHQEEQGHYDLIQSEIDSINGTGFWFDVNEFNMDGKF